MCSTGATNIRILMATPVNRYGRRWWLVNYSSAIDGPDLPWIAGQFRPTKLYETELTFED